MKHTIKGYVVCSTRWDDTLEFDFFSFDPSSEIYTTVMEHSFEVDIPDNFDPRPGQVEVLKIKKAKVQAEFAKKVKEIETSTASVFS
jgi:hypothetical protein